jgi:ABC-2 type transport system ATP-binding protein
VQALDGLDLAVPRGAVAGLLGPNGSGKSTTIRLLLGLHAPTAGEARVLGLPAGHREARRRTGYMPEEADLYPFLTARETVETAGALHGMERRECRAAAGALLERVGLAAEADRRVEGFSRGMKRRAGLAAALVHGPELLVLDEPTAGLDPVGREGLLSLLEECRGRGTTVLLSSHILSDVERLCDRVAILGQGRLAAEGTLAEVLEREDSFTLEVTGGAAVADAAARAAEEAGGAVSGRRPTREPLERTFLRLLGRDRGGPGDDRP